MLSLEEMLGTGSKKLKSCHHWSMGSKLPFIPRRWLRSSSAEKAGTSELASSSPRL